MYNYDGTKGPGERSNGKLPRPSRHRKIIWADRTPGITMVTTTQGLRIMGEGLIVMIVVKSETANWDVSWDQLSLLVEPTLACENYIGNFLEPSLATRARC